MLALMILSMMSILLDGTPSNSRPSVVDQVNPMIGTAADGQTFPATGVPFGMTQWTPQTRDGEKKCIAPYYIADRRIQGFRGSHFMSGSCTQDYGSVTLMPMTGELKLGAAERSSAFARSQERSAPYRYAVRLTDYDIQASITGTSRAGMLRFQFDRAGKSWIVLQNNSRAGEGSLTIDAEHHEISGVNPVHRLYAGNGKPAGISGYFVVRFDHSFTAQGTWSGKTRHVGATRQAGATGAHGAYISFAIKPSDVVLAKVGTSFTSIDEARRNLDAEIPGWDYQQVENQARAKWSEALEKIQIQEPDAAKRHVFYSALYHSMLLPRESSDVSGTYPGFAGEGKTEIAKGFTYYDDYSLWDTFRAVHPLFTVIEPERELDMVKSLIAKGEQGGFLPIYPAWNSYTSEMIGDHAVTVIGDAYAKGIRGFDIEEAYRLMRKNAMEQPASFADYADGRGRRALGSYLKYGYIPLEDKVPEGYWHKNEQVSRTLEYAYDDFVVGQVARALGHEDDAEMFRKRAQNYRNVIDPVTGYARGRHADGSWDSPFDPAVAYSYITEGLPSQYTFFVPQDLDGLISLVGGRDAFIKKLDGLFAGGYYDHGNEPSHHIAYLYDNAGAAWKTQMNVRKLMDTKYLDRPDGLAGNDDCGQMSAWYVLSALGFYPVTPGVPIYQIGTPLFDEATILLPGGKHLRIVAPGASKGKQYIHAATLNGVLLNRFWITHEEIVGGGELRFEMSSEPDLHWPLSLR
jgi:predicted alpha-1,2-mannosidase